MYCRQCGKEVRPDTRFCGACGAPIGKAAPSPAFKSRITPKVWIVVGSLVIIVLLGIAGTFGLARWNEHEATQLFTEANQLVQKGQTAEDTSYAEAFEHYKAALDNAKAIPRDYPSTSPAARLLQDPTLGPHTLTELDNTVVPEMQKKAGLEGDPLAVSRFLLEQINDNDKKDIAARGLAGHYGDAGRYNEAMEVIETIGSDTSKKSALSRLAKAHANAGNFDQAEQIAESIDNLYHHTYRTARARLRAETLAKKRSPDEAKEILDREKQIADSIANTYQKRYARGELELGYLTVANAYIDLEQYQQAEAIAHTIRWSDKVPSILARIADKYAESQQFEEARAFAERIQDSVGKASALAAIGKRYAEAGHFDEAMGIVQELQEQHNKDTVLAGIAAAHARSGRYDEAIQIANGIQSPDTSRETFATIAKASGNGEQVPPTLLPTVNDMADPVARSSALGDIAEVLAQAGHLDEALQFSGAIGDVETRVARLVHMADHYSATKKAKEAARSRDEIQKIAGNIEDETSKAGTLASLAGTYARAGRLDRAMQFAATIDNPYSKSSALRAIAESYEQAGQMDKALGVLAPAIQTVKALTYGKDYTAPGDSPQNTLSKMASSLASDNHFALALHVCESLEGLSDQIDTLGDIGAKYAQSGQKLDNAARKILHDIIAANQ